MFGTARLVIRRWALPKRLVSSSWVSVFSKLCFFGGCRRGDFDAVADGSRAGRLIGVRFIVEVGSVILMVGE